ncbi:hypothetical protein MAMC_01974 [Methylacidimicrobium cyclopophantes]|uniref:Uncharacterized protein n=1 Tax=Methylacidimicrobium cyclopophantes TaxID=1041766 RepID=A0A5E6MIM1_9BACT|nr:hypothetical protein [Methylacidimicrobium cyclopophantes]VVM08083.1 hypothetical protein MAMC_01974 [Methylacidimicrobium cyclopophantes]
MIRFFLGVALIGSLATAVLGFLLANQRNTIRREYEKTAAQLKSVTEQAEESKVLAAEAQKKLEETRSKMTEATEKLAQIENQAGNGDSRVAEAEQRAKEAEQRAQQEKAEIEELGSKLESEKAASEAATAKVESLLKEKQALEENLSKLTAEVARMREVSPSTVRAVSMRSGIRGKVVSVNRNWNFVVLNVGEKDGLVENGVLNVYRSGQPVGKVKIVSTEASTAVADVEAGSDGGGIQPGDDVLN